MSKINYKYKYKTKKEAIMNKADMVIVLGVSISGRSARPIFSEEN